MDDNNQDLSAQIAFAQAFYSMSTLVCGRLIAAGLADRDKLVEEIEVLADQAGRELQKTMNSVEFEPNAYLLHVATQVGLIASTGVMEVNKLDPSPEDQVGG